MLFTTVKIDGTDYKLRLTTKSLVNLERRIKRNPLSIFMTIKKDELPLLGDMLTVFHESLQTYQHSITEDDVYDLYDKYIDEGNTYVDFISLVMEIYKTSGLFKDDKEEDKKSKGRGTRPTKN